MICLDCVAGVRLSPIQFVGAMDDVYLFLQSRDSRFPRGFRAHRQSMPASSFAINGSFRSGVQPDCSRKPSPSRAVAEEA